MLIIITYIRFILMVLSLFGYARLFEKKYGVNKFISPLLSISLITLVVYFSGLLKIMRYVPYIIFAIGLFLFFISISKLRREDIINIEVINIFNFTLLFCFLLLVIILLSLKLIHYDNFSHWAVVVKHMLIEDAFPTASSVLIDFKNYPLGTSSWIYYVCKIAGNGQGVMLAAQGIMIYASFYSLFSIIRDKKRLLLSNIIMVSAGIMTLYNISIRLNNLLVDFVLPLITLGIITAIYYYRNDLKKCCLIITPIIALLLLVKNNAIIFAAICYIYLLYYAFKNRGEKRVIVYSIICIVISMLVYASWSYHTKVQFKGMDFKFDVSSSIENSNNSKTSDEIEIILDEFSERVFTLSNTTTTGYLSLNLIIIITCLVSRAFTNKKWYTPKILIIGNLVYILYYIGILAMYIFMMPIEEAVYLAGFTRYSSSIFIFFLGILTLSLVRDIENSLYIQQGKFRDIYAFKSIRSKKVYMNSTLVLGAVSILLLTSEINEMIYLDSQYYETLPGKVEMIVGDRFYIGDDKHYAIYATDTDSQVSNDYLGYIARYMLMNSNIYTFSDFNDEYIKENMKNFDYLLIVESDKAAKKYIQNNFQGDGSNGIYKIK